MGVHTKGERGDLSEHPYSYVTPEPRSYLLSGTGGGMIRVMARVRVRIVPIALLLLACFMATSAGCRSVRMAAARYYAEPARKDPPSDIEVVRDVVFAETEDGPLALDLFRPAAGTRAAMPVVVFIYGGGWFVGSKNQIQQMKGFKLVRRGYAVAAVSYRLSDVATFPAQIHDVKAAVRWVRANAVDYGLDPSRVAAWGGSAGGHLAALLGVTNGNAELEGAVGGATLAGQSSDVQAVIDFFGPTDLAALATEGGGEQDTSWMVEQLVGGSIAERMDVVQRASPATWVTADAPPFLIVQGDEDPLVPLSQSTRFHAQLEAVGVDSTLQVFGGGRHGQGPGFDDPDALIERIADFLDRVMGGDAAER